jgi:hypothetical protein
MVNENQFNRAIEVIKANEIAPTWVGESRKKTRELKALVTGENFADELIHNIEHLRVNDRALARQKYSKDIRDLYSRTYKNRI